MNEPTRRTAILRRLIIVSAFVVQFGSQSTAQSVETEEAAIRAALTKWTEDFNAGNVEQVCGLFTLDLRYDYRGFPERGYQEICDGLRRSLTDHTKRYDYSLAIKEVIVSSNLAVVRLIWTLRVTKPDAPPQVSQEYGIDIFRKQPDGTWKIIRFIAYDEAG
jgi:uncharacterized protein (TIGR02246 family)